MRNYLTTVVGILATVFLIFLVLAKRDIQSLLTIIEKHESQIEILNETIRLHENNETYLTESFRTILDENTRLDSIVRSFTFDDPVECHVEEDEMTNERTIIRTIISDRIRPDIDGMLTEAYDSIYQGTN